MSDYPLEKFEYWVKVLAGIFVLAFFALNLTALFFWSPDSFQRLGSFGVALLILVFAFTRVVIKEIRTAIEGHGLYAEKFEKSLEDVTFSEDKGWLNFMSKDGVQYERPLYSREEILASMKQFETQTGVTIIANELFLAAIATLQWGYGDLFHCLIHGKGWGTC